MMYPMPYKLVLLTAVTPSK